MKPDSFFKGTSTYLLDEKLAEAFHIARLLEKPLLLEGEPGTGKTKLAQEFAIQEDRQILKFRSPPRARFLNWYPGLMKSSG